MKHNVFLIITSVLSIFLMTVHLTDDIIRGMASGGPSNIVALPILAFWLYGTLVLAERRSRYVIIIVGSLFGLLMPVVHMTGAGISGEIANSSGGFLFVWTLIALGVTSLFSVILAVRGLWRLQRPTQYSK